MDVMIKIDKIGPERFGKAKIFLANSFNEIRDFSIEMVERDSKRVLTRAKASLKIKAGVAATTPAL
jgi:hypothetical protein